MTEPEVTQRQFAEGIETGNYFDQLVLIRRQLAEMIDNPQRAVHRRECDCVCGIGDDRTLVPILKELRAVIEVIDGLPAQEGTSRLDRIAARHDDELETRRRRAAGLTGATG